MRKLIFPKNCTNSFRAERKDTHSRTLVLYLGVCVNVWMCIVCVCVARNHRNIGAAEAARKKFSIYCDLLMRLEKSEVRNGRSRKEGKEQQRGRQPERGGAEQSRAERNGIRRKAEQSRQIGFGMGRAMGSGCKVLRLLLLSLRIQPHVSLCLCACECVCVWLALPLASSIISLKFNNNYSHTRAKTLRGARNLCGVKYFICHVQHLLQNSKSKLRVYVWKCACVEVCVCVFVVTVCVHVAFWLFQFLHCSLLPFCWAFRSDLSLNLATFAHCHTHTDTERVSHCVTVVNWPLRMPPGDQAGLTGT